VTTVLNADVATRSWRLAEEEKMMADVQDLL